MKDSALLSASQIVDCINKLNKKNLRLGIMSLASETIVLLGEQGPFSAANIIESTYAHWIIFGCAIVALVWGSVNALFVSDQPNTELVECL
jgi:hypothetical protein